MSCHDKGYFAAEEASSVPDSATFACKEASSAPDSATFACKEASSAPDSASFAVQGGIVGARQRDLAALRAPRRRPPARRWRL
jgi:hypothetical protein